MSENNNKNSLDEWFAGLSHDLRNPVHGILSYAGFGIKKIGSGQLTEEKSLHYYQSIKEAGTKLLEMLEDIVLLAKLDTGRIPLKISEWNLVTVVQGVLSGFSRYGDIEATMAFNEPESPVTGRFDSKRIGEVIRRLLDICLVTAEEGVTLKLEVDSPGAENRLEKEAIRFTLEHPSVDYSDERLEEMQQLLSSGSSEGKPGQVGLSLAVCQRIVGLHGGRVWVERMAAGGVVFGFLLPVEN